MQNQKNIEQAAGDALAAIWDDLDQKARIAKPDEYANAQKMFEDWAGKLITLLAGKSTKL